MLVKMLLWFSMLTLMFTSGLGLAAEKPVDAPAVSPQDLLKPDMLPNAQFGMALVSAEDGPVAKVVTTGGEFIVNKSNDTIECKQLISKQRTVATINFAKGTLISLKLTHKSSGAAIFTGNGTTVRINGDSLLMVQPAKNGDIKAALAFTPDYHREFFGNYNFFDPDGGISFFENGICPDSKIKAKVDPVTVTWPWKGGDVFWAGVSPPKPYDWDYPLNNRPIFHGSSDPRYFYPSDLAIKRWKECGFGNVVYLGSETQWTHWQLQPLPPKDPVGLKRVVNTAHENGMKCMVYLSPYFFIKGDPDIEGKAIEDTHRCPGSGKGCNEPVFLEYAARLIKEYNIDGLFFDSIYTSPDRKSLATNYHISRASREIVGENGILEYHCTTDLFNNGHQGAYCPTIHAYYNFILKGEGEYDRMTPGYVRYQGSTYNISNSAAAWCYFNEPPSPEEVDIILKANIHLHFPAFFIYTGEDAVYRNKYWPRLTSSLKDEIASDLQKHVGDFDAFRKSINN